MAPIVRRFYGKGAGQCVMSPLSAYTPFESLLFVQSLARLDARPSSFVPISNYLRENPFIRQDLDYSPDRLSPEALEDLYGRLMKDGSDVVDRTDDSAGPSSPKRRKLSNLQTEKLSGGIGHHVALLPKLVSRLYAVYKDFVIKEIKNDETRYDGIKREIEQLQRKEQEEIQKGEAAQHRPPPPPQPTLPVSSPLAAAKPEPPVRQPEHMQVDVTEGRRPSEVTSKKPIREVGVEAEKQHETNVPQQPARPGATPPHPQIPLHTQPPRPLTEEPLIQARRQQLPHPERPLQNAPLAPLPPPNVRPPNARENPTPQPSPRQQLPSANNGVSPVPPSPPIANEATPAAPVVPPYQAGQQPPVQVPVSAPLRRKSREGPPMTVPAVSPRPIQGQPSFHQWSLNEPRMSYQQAPYPITSQRNSASARQPAVQLSPQQVATSSQPKGLHPSLHAHPVLPAASRQLPMTATQHALALAGQTPAAANQVPFVKPSLSAPTPKSLTPWKKVPLRVDIPTSPRQPRPEDVSPISDRASSPRIETPSETRRESTTSRKRPVARKRRRQSSAEPVEEQSPEADINKPAAKRRLRDVSIPSSRSHEESGKVKHEVPNTPVDIPRNGEPEQPRASARLRGAAPEIATPDDHQPSTARGGRSRRKRVASEEVEAEQEQREASRASVDGEHASQYVLCTRNFPRTGAPIMNNVSSHKHASVFTKPLTEREAPGYRDLIYRPQDLKSIKSALSHGSKAVTAAAAEASTPGTDSDSPAPSAGATASNKNAVLMLQKTEDIIPPKGIVNSSQLEKELIRMFANAIMFNPVPQRGGDFGPAFPMISDEDDEPYRQASPTASEAEEAEEEGAIINDTLEMFLDVENAVTRWRSAERTAEELSNKSIVSINKGSVGDVNADAADDGK